MRGLFVAMLLMALLEPARACPRGAACVSTGTHATGELARPAPVRPARLQLAALEPRSLGFLESSLRTHVVPRSPAIEMPWIWVMLRRSVYAKLPTYERVARRPENRFSLVMSPVVVTSPQDTIPGLGIEGGF